MKFIIAYIDKIILDEEFNGMTFKNINKKEFDYLAEDIGKNKALIIS